MPDEFAVPAISPLDVADWRIKTYDLYARVRTIAETDPLGGHIVWQSGRDEMFVSHPASPLLDQKRGEFEGLTYFDYDPALWFETIIEPAPPETRDVTTGTDGVVQFERVGTYGAGRYLIDTIKGAHLGQNAGSLVLDFNFAYNPSCVYDPRWLCPLAGAGNTIATEIAAGERLGHSAA